MLASARADEFKLDDISDRQDFQCGRNSGLSTSTPTTKDLTCTMATHVLFESASGYALFEVKLHEEVGAKTKSVQDSFSDLAKFQKMVNLLSFSPFKSAAHALENANDVSEGMICFIPHTCAFNIANS